MADSVPGVELDASTRATLVRGVLWPAWALTALLVVPGAVGLTVPPVVQYVPLFASVVLFGLPHGAVDHLAPSRVRGESPTWPAIGAVFALYAVLGAAYAIGWLLAPAAAFAAFLLLTWVHWGQGDLYALRAFLRVDYLDAAARRALAVAVRGGLPMLVPLLSFPAWYRRVAGAVVAPFGSPTDLAPLFRFETRLLLAIAYGLVVLGYLTVGFLRTDRLRAWAVDAGETVLLAAYFLLVPPVVAVGVYFCVWHGYRHVARLAVIEPDSRMALSEGRLWIALARFGREATPLTLASLALLAGVYLLAPGLPADPLGWIGRYLVVVAVLTLPHVVVVSVMDYEQAVWA